MGARLDEKQAKRLLDEGFLDDVMVESYRDDTAIAIRGTKKIPLSGNITDLDKIRNDYVDTMLKQGWVETDCEISTPSAIEMYSTSGEILSVPTRPGYITMTFLQDPDRALEKIKNKWKREGEMFGEVKKYDLEKNEWGKSCEEQDAEVLASNTPEIPILVTGDYESGITCSDYTASLYQDFGCIGTSGVIY